MQRPDPSGDTAENALSCADVAMPPRHDAFGLTEGGPTAEILLNGQIYTLRITKQGRLILTK